MPKRLQMLHEVLPKASAFAMLMNSQQNNRNLETDKNDIQAAAAAIGVQVFIVYAAGEGDPETAFTQMIQKRVAGFLVHSDAVLFNRRSQIVALAARHALPAIYPSRESVELGGLISYAADVDHVVRQAGIYVGRILQGEAPANLAIQQPTKFEMVLNLKTAKALGLTIAPLLLAQADEVIE